MSRAPYLGNGPQESESCVDTAIDGSNNRVLQDFAQLVSDLCTTAFAGVTLYDQLGPRIVAFHGHSLDDLAWVEWLVTNVQDQEQWLEVSDTHHDPHFQTADGVMTSPFVRFYASVPIRAEDGSCLGALSLFDFQPRTLTSTERALLQSLSEVAGRLLPASPQHEETIHKRDAFLDVVLENIQVGIVVCNQDGVLTQFNRATRTFHGLPQMPLTSELWSAYYDLYLPDGVTRMSQDDIPLVRALRGITVANEEMMIVPRCGGATRYLLVNGQQMLDTFGEVIGAFISMQDITEQKEVERKLQLEMELAQTTLHSIGEGVISVDGAGLIRYINPVAQALTAWSFEEAVRRPFHVIFQMVHDETHEPLPCPILKVFQTGQMVREFQHTALRSRTGEVCPVEVTVTPLATGGAQTQGVVLVFRDVTESRELHRKLAYQATHDDVTGLPNRKHFEHCVEKLQMNGDGHTHALLYLDLDQFKVVNDTCGHQAGDDMLRLVSTCLQSHLESDVAIARLGGDEFGILLPNVTADVALQRAETLVAQLRRQVFHWQDRTFAIRTSVGLVPFAAPATSASLLSAADAACYLAKEKGRNQVQVHEVDDAELMHHLEEMNWIAKVNQSLIQDRFELYHQRITAMDQADPVLHYEILLRMRDESNQLIPPSVFIPAAERYNIMPLIDRWVISHCFDRIRRITEDISKNGVASSIQVAINLSGSSLADKDFLPFVLEAFASSGVQPSTICFEITETAAISNFERALVFMKHLSEMGCRFALDDFGSGLSSFGYVKVLPFDYIKIDGTFVQNLANEPIDRAIVEAIHRMAQVMGKQTIAEFVESEEVVLTLREIGVHYAQGYAFHRPEPWQA